MKEKKSNFKGKLVESYKRQRETKGGFGYLNLPKDIDMLNIPDDTRSFSIDILPYKVTSERHLDRNSEYGFAIPGSLWYRLPIKIHRNIGANNESIICPTIIGKKCPVCEYRVKRIKEGAPKEEFKLLYPRERSIYPVIPLHKDFKEEIMLWDMSDFLFQETLMDELQERTDCEDFFTLENGKTIILRLKWKEIGNNKFPEVVSIDFKERDPFSQEVLKDIPSLDDMPKVLSYEEIAAKFFDEEVTDEGLTDVQEEVEIEEISRRTGKYQRQKREKEEEEPEEKETSKPLRRARVEKEETDIVSKPERTGRVAKEKTGDKCPHGHEFGVDTDEFKDCNTCDVWDDCDDAKEDRNK